VNKARDRAVEAFNKQQLERLQFTGFLMKSLIDKAASEFSLRNSTTATATAGGTSKNIQPARNDVTWTMAQSYAFNLIDSMEDWSHADIADFRLNLKQLIVAAGSPSTPAEFVNLLEPPHPEALKSTQSDTQAPADTSTNSELQKSRDQLLSVWNSQQIAAINRGLLELLYRDVIRERTMVSTRIVAEKDQATRWKWLAVWGTAAFLLAFFVNANKDSAFFKYYINCLERFYLQAQALPAGDTDQTAAAALFEVDQKLQNFDTCSRGMPYHLISTSLMRRPGNYGQVTFDPFLFSKNYCGNFRDGYAITSRFPDAKEPLTLGRAIATSGAAFTPLMTANPAIRLLMRFFNFSLGEYVPNPRHAGRIRFPRSLLGVTFSQVLDHSKPDYHWKVGFVADGGFRDFLGVEDLLRRRCRLIIAADAGSNVGKYEFGALADLVRLARTEHGIEFLELDSNSPLAIDRFRRKTADSPVPQQFILARIRYPRSETSADPEGTPQFGLLIYIQMALTGKEDVDLQQFRRQHPDFPYADISDQFFTPQQVESYRSLGYHIGKQVCRVLPAWQDSSEEAKPAPRPNNCQCYPLKCSRRMPIAELEYRLKLAYLESSREELIYDTLDVSAEAIFDLDKDLLSPVLNYSPPIPPHATPEDWIQLYENNADFRLYWRYHISQKFKYFLTLDGEIQRSPRLWRHTTLKSATCPGELAVLLIICNEFCAWKYAYHSAAGLGQKTNFSQIQSLFQIEGRERLIRIAVLHLAPNDRYDSENWEVMFPWEVPSDHDGSMDSGETLIQNLANGLRSIFRSSVAETARLFTYLWSYESCPPQLGRPWVNGVKAPRSRNFDKQPPQERHMDGPDEIPPIDPPEAHT